MLSLEIVVTSRKFQPTSVTRLDVDLTEEEILAIVRGVTHVSVSPKDAFVGIFQAVRTMPGGSNLAEITREPLIGADYTVVADYTGTHWNYRIHRPQLA